MKNPAVIAALATIIISIGVIAPALALATRTNNMTGTSNDCPKDTNGHTAMNGDNWEEHERKMHGDNWQNHMGGNMTPQRMNNSCH